MSIDRSRSSRSNLARIELHASDAVQEGQVVARIVPLAPPLLDARTRAEAEARLAERRARREQARFSIEHARELLAFAERESARQRQLASIGLRSGAASAASSAPR